MEKFSKILENKEIKKYYKIECSITLSIEADNEGEASYIADSTLSSVKNQSSFIIKEVSEIAKDEFLSDTELTTEDGIQNESEI